MQTFLPYRSFTESASVLDHKRLGKQRVEVLQILNALTNPNYGWQNHPAVNMWRGYDFHLIQYGLAICKEWQKRGYKDTCAQKILMFAQEMIYAPMPTWLGNEDFHNSHKSNLLRKFPEYYKQFWPDMPSNLPYVWPKN